MSANTCSHWFGEDFRGWPTVRPAMIERIVRHSDTFCPFGETSGFAVPCHQSVFARVSTLLNGKRPHTIPWFVGSIVIDPIKRVARRWPWTHVGEECREVMAPSVADADAASSVVFVVDRVRVVTTPQHTLPYGVFGTVRHAVAAVCIAALETLAVQASAAFRVSVSQFRSNDNGRSSAITATDPVCRLALTMCSREYSETPEAFAAHIDQHAFHAAHII